MAERRMTERQQLAEALRESMSGAAPAVTAAAVRIAVDRALPIEDEEDDNDVEDSEVFSSFPENCTP
jgi:Tfp pilus assembly PilM family ATPase